MAESNTTPSQSAIAEIDHGPSKLDQFLDKHTSKLIILAILIALGVIVYVVKSGLDEAKAQEAGAALVSAETSEELEKVSQQWSGSAAGGSALPLLAESQWEDAKDSSIATLEKFISENPAHAAVASSKISLALKLLEQGKTSEATDLLTEVADSDTASYIAPLAAITLGDIAKETGDLAKAKIWYEQAKEDPSEQGNSFAQIADNRILLVDAKPPVKIQPALPEPPAAPSPPNIPADPAATLPTPTVPNSTLPAVPAIPAVPTVPTTELPE